MYIYMKYYLATKNEILPFMTWMDLEGIMLNEISQMEKDKTIWFNLKVESKKQNKQQNRVTESKWVDAEGEVWVQN